MIVSVSETKASEQSRMVAIRLASMTLRFMENWRREAGSYEEAMIILAMIAITADRLLRTTIPIEIQNLREPMQTERLARCNIASIAAATGINRETLRRRLNRMIAGGAIVRLPDGGFQFAPGFLQQDHMVDVIRMQLDSLRGLIETLTHDGIFEISAGAGGQGW